MGMASRSAWLALGALALSACSPAQVPAAPQPPGAPVSVDPPAAKALVPFAPYVDVTATHPSFASVMAVTSVRRFVLSFAVSTGSTCQPSWGGTKAINDPALLNDIATVRAAGGGVTAATGGATGTYLENTCATAADLAAAYRAVLSATGADRLEVDVETKIPVDLVADALTSVQDDLKIPVTITAMVDDADQGITKSAMSLLDALAGRGTDDVEVNAMLMNFPDGGDWRGALLGAADSVADQIEEVWPDGGRPAVYHRLGLTIMPGRNDTGVITTLEDARAVGDYARDHQIGFVGLWSLARDNGGCPDRAEASAACSGVSQDAYAFTRSVS
jgi:chitinase